MPANFISVSLERVFLFSLLLVLSTSLIGQTITAKDGTIGIRQEFVHKKIGDQFIMENLVPGEFYAITLTGDQNCFPVIEMVDSDAGTLVQDDYLLQFQPEQSRVQFILADWGACKLDNNVFTLSLNCETCDTYNPDDEKRMMNLMTSPQSAQSLITDVFIGGGCFDVQNVQASGSFGYFSNGAASIGFDDGVILSSGAIATAPGPNNGEGTSGASGGGADADLQAISTANVTQTAIIEFDFRPTIDNVQFAYSFASEEYCEYVNSTFNDVFGFFISGPGIAGTFTNGAINIATLPDGTPVSINNVNHLLNQGFFQGANGSCSAPTNPNISFDGWTAPLVAEATLIPCETYHIKLAVGDVGDGIFDSAVFLGGNSFKAGSLGQIQADIPGLSADFQGLAVEDCGDGFIIFNRVGSPDGEIIIPLSINPASTATNGVDFTNVPTTVVIPEGVYQVLVPFTIFQDFIIEGVETIIFDIESSCNCSVTSFQININDNVPLLSSGEDYDFCSQQSIVLNANPIGGAPPFTYEWSTNPPSFGPSVGVAPNETTIYTVTITDECGQTTESDYTVEVAANVTASMAGEYDICGEFDQVDVLVALEGPGPWTLQYAFNGDLQPEITDIYDNPYIFNITEAGVYNLVTVASGGCPGNAFGQVIINEGELSYATEVSNVSCNATGDGSITVTPFGGDGGYSYVWEGSANGSNTLDMLGPGTYNVTMEDGIGCSAEATFTLIQPEPPVVASVVPTNVDCDNLTGSIDLTVTPGTSTDLTITWDQGVGEVEDPSGLAPNTYTATITDASGCEITTTTEIIGDLEPPLVAAADIGAITCIETSVDLSGAGSSTGTNISYSWTNSVNSEVSTDLNFSTSLIDTYTLLVTNSDNGCTAEASATVMSDLTEPVAAIATPDQLNCDVLQVELNGGGSTGNNPLSYTWYNDVNTEIGTGSTYNASTPDVFTLVVTDQVNGCTAEQLVGVTQNIIPPTSDAGLDGFLTCTMDEATLTGSGTSSSGSVNYSWLNENDVEEGITPSVTVSAAGVYTLLVTDPQNGCTAESTAEVAPDENLPQVEVDEDGTITCDNSEATITGLGSSTGTNFSYQWYNPDGTPLTTDVMTTVTQSGVYVLSITNTDNGCTAENSVLVPEDIAPPLVEAGDDGLLTCTETDVDLIGSSADDPNTEFTYEWFDDTSTSVGTGPDLNVSIAGVYTLEVIGTNGCMASDIVEVTLDNNLPVADAGTPATITCQIPSIEIGGPLTSTGPDLQYSWTNEDDDEVSTDMNYTTTEPGTYTLTVFDPNNQCETTDEVIIAEDIAMPAVDVGNPDDLDCDVLEAILGGSGTSTGPEFNYAWTNEADDLMSTDPTYVTAHPGTYTLLVYDTSNDCNDEESITVYQDIVIPNADAGADESFDCETEELTFTANTTGNSADTEYSWLDSGDMEVSDSETFTTTNTGTYTLVVTNPGNGCSFTDDIVVGTAVDVPVSDAGPSGTLTCTVESIVLGGPLTSTDPGLQYSWTDENDVEVATTPTFMTEDPGTFTLTVFNPANECSSNAQAIIAESVDYPTVDAGANGAIDCDNLSFQLGGSNTSVGSEFSYEWTDGNNVVVSNDPTYTTSSEGTFTLTVINTDNDCEVDAQVSVTEDLEYPLANAGADADFDCIVNSILLQADQTQTGNNISYSWLDENDVEVSTLPDYSTTETGTYTLVVSNVDNGCEETDEVIIGDISQVLVAEAGADATLTCLVEQIQLGGSGTSSDPGLDYSWTDQNNVEVATTPTFTTTTEGTFTLTVSNALNQCEESAVVAIASNIDYPTIDAGANGQLDCDDLTFELGGTNNSTGTEFEYQWTDLGGTVLSNDINYTTSNPGDYIFSILNTDNDCAVDATVSVGQDILDPIAYAGVDANFNCIDNTIELAADQNQNAPNISYTWFDETGTVVSSLPNYSTTAEGTFTLEVTNNDNGCITTDAVVIGTDVDYPLADAGSSATIDCDNLSQLVGGSGSSVGTNISYVWTNEANVIVSNDMNFSTSTSGTYYLNVINTENFCETDANVVILENTIDPVVALGSGGILNCDVEELTLGDPNTSQGSTITYDWSLNGSSGAGSDLYLQITQPGNYNLFVTNTENGCTAEQSIVVNEDIQTPGAEAGPDGIYDCDDVLVDLFGSSNSVGANIEYAWYNSGNVLVGTTLNAQVDQTGTYQLVVTNTDNGCSSEDFAVIEPSEELPNALAAADGILTCDISQVNLSALNSSTFSGNIQYTWTDPNNTVISNDADLMTSDPGTYTVEITDPDNGCQASISVEVQENVAQPTVEAGADLVFDCNSDFLTLLGQGQGTGNIQYTWTDGTGTTIGTSNTQQVSSTGTYYLSVLDEGNGCTNADQVQVIPDQDLPVVNANPGATLDCDLLEYTLDASGSATGTNIQYTWLDENDNVLASGLTYEVTNPGLYTLQVLDTDNNCADETDVLIEQDIDLPTPAIVAQSGLSLDCDITELILDASSSQPNGMISFAWSNANDPGTVISTNPILNVNDPGTYVLTILNTENGCDDIQQEVILENVETPELGIADPDQIICDFPEVQLSAEDINNISNVTILWTTNVVGGIVDGENTLTPTIGLPGTYTLTMTNNDNGCVDVESIEVISEEEYPDAFANVEDMLDCVTEEVGISGLGSSEGPGFTYEWSGPGIITNGNTLNPMVNSEGTYLLLVTNGDNNCKTPVEVEVERNDNEPTDLEASITPPPCAGQPGEIQIQSIEGGTAPYMYAINGGSYTDVPQWSTLMPGIYNVQVEDMIGCTHSETVEIPQTEPIQVDLDAQVNITIGESSQLNTSLFNFTESEIASIEWTPADNLSCTNCLNPVASPSESTVYTVRIINEDGCPAEDDILLRVKTKVDIYIPTAFSPNGDGENEIFHIFASLEDSGVEEIEEFIIADRWGEIVFQDRNFQPNDPDHGWNGRMGQDGELFNPAVFVYYARVRLINNSTQEFEGDVTLIR